MDKIQFERVAIAAKRIGKRRQLLQKEIARGKIRVIETACGLPLVSVKSVNDWADNYTPGQPGRPKQGLESTESTTDEKPAT